MSSSGSGPFVRLRQREWEEFARDRLDVDTARRFEQQLEHWELDVSGRPIPWVGAAKLVIPVARRDGTPAVLKLNPDDEEVRHEGAALRAFDGDGAVRVLESDADGGALLLERLTPGEPLEAHSDREEAIGIVCGLLRRLWRAVPSDHPFVTASELAGRWRQELSVRYDRARRPFERAPLDAALAACEELARPAGPAIIANRDVHLGNVISAQREPWLLIDPQPVLGEPAFDLAYLAQDLLPRCPSGAELHATVDRLTGELEVAADRVRQWMLVRTIDNALDGISCDATWGWRELQIARLLVAEQSRPGTRRQGDPAGPDARRRDRAGEQQ